MQMRLANSQTNGGRPNSRAGMTLVEVSVALAIAGVAIGGIISGYNFCTQASRKSALTLAANAMALQRLEETRSAIWDVSTNQLFATNFPSRDVTLDLAGNGSVSAEGTVYTYISQISTNPPLRRIRVDCVWEYNGQPMTNRIETLRTSSQ
jgi:prepilin-type N-terminal cleavage/methylation domain-containing protein